MIIYSLLHTVNSYHFQIFYQLTTVLAEVVIWNKCRVLPVRILSLLLIDISKDYDLGIGFNFHKNFISIYTHKIMFKRNRNRHHTKLCKIHERNLTLIPVER
jgi:hypothetical protein